MSSTPLYSPLGLSRRYIRVLTITSAEDCEDISCSLENCDLYTEPKYQALSYAWGSSRDARTISVNGNKFQISSNLHDFFQVYRTRDRNTAIWIDQLRINQTDTGEKNEQVSVMGTIYRLAQQTIVWLGVDPHAGVAIKFLISWETRVQGEGIEGADIVRTEPENTAFRALAAVPYWKRHWVAQEVILSRSVIFLYGYNEVPWQALAMKYRYDHRPVWTDLLILDTYGLLSLKARYEQMKTGSDHSTLFKHLIAFAAGSLCVDPRDKVYGIQGLLPPAFQIPVDYDRSVRAVFIRAAQCWRSCFCYVPIKRKQLEGLDTEPPDQIGLWFLAQCVKLASGMNLIDLPPAIPVENFASTRYMLYDNARSKPRPPHEGSRSVHKTLSQGVSSLRARPERVANKPLGGTQELSIRARDFESFLVDYILLPADDLGSACLSSDDDRD